MRSSRILFGVTLAVIMIAAYSGVESAGQEYPTTLTGAYSHADASEPAASNATVPLVAGWNLVALPLAPVNAAPNAVLAPIAGQYDIVYRYEACDLIDPWKKYDPAAPSFVNDLTSITVEQGLWIHAKTNTVLTVTGTAPVQVSIPLCAGANLIGYPSGSPVALPDALASIAGKYTLIHAYDPSDAADPWKTFDPSAPPFVNDLTAMKPGQGYWIQVTTPTVLAFNPQTTPARRINAPYFDAGIRFSEMAVFWFGRVTPTENYADVRVGYDPQRLLLHLAIFDRRLWYNPSPSGADLTAWDAATIYLKLDGNQGSTLDTKSYRFVGQLNWWEQPRTQWQSAYTNGDGGTGWQVADLPFTTTSGWSGDVPNNDADDRGWQLYFSIPFASLGLSGPPASGTVWGAAVVLHDRDDAAGAPIATKVWPESVTVDRPVTWGQLTFGLPTYTPAVSTPAGTVTIRHKLNGATVADAAVGGYAVCGAGTDFWTQWGETNEAFYNSARDRFNVQNQEDISDWPCFSKYYVTFPLTDVPTGKSILSSTLTLYQIGNAGEGWTPGPQPSFIQILTVDQDWNENTLTWNNAPSATENITGTWVEPLATFPGWPGVPRQWDVSYAMTQAYAAGRPLRLAVYSADSPYHSGRYFTASDIDDWDEVGRPTLRVTWGEPGQ